jgi:predicted aspartyl protease
MPLSGPRRDEGFHEGDERVSPLAACIGWSRRRRRIAFVAAGWLSVTFPVVVADGPESVRVEVPFELHEHFIVAKGSIGPLDDLNLIIDTGTSSTTLGHLVARKLGLLGETRTVLAYAAPVRIQAVTIPTLSIGPFRFDEVPGWVAELSFPDMRRTLRIDALIGLDLLKRTPVTIDYESRTLRFGPVVHSERPIAFYGGLPFIPIHLFVRGKPFRVLLDTAAGDLILCAAQAQGRVELWPTGEQKIVRSGAGRRTVKRVFLPGISIRDTHWGRTAAYLHDGPVHCDGMDGILGPLSMGLKRLHLDCPAGLLSWDR